jgi:hypothetical protein
MYAGQRQSQPPTHRENLNMSKNVFRMLPIALAAAFTVAFVVVCLPPLLQHPEIFGAFGGGFVNPYASGYAMDVFFIWSVFAALVAYEANVKGIRYGWMALALGLVPGVAVGLTSCLLLSLKHERVGS